MKKTIVIDTDPGIDDAVALIMALSATELDVRAITVVAGNCDVGQGVRNALGIVELMSATNVPVARGADRPRQRPYRPAGTEIHGSNGLGGATLPAPSTPTVSMSGAEMLIESVRRSPGTVTIVALAPLTNLAQAIDLCPEIVRSVQRVILMGGAICAPGNATEHAECNIFNDPHAADLVLSSGMPITLVPLDVTRCATVVESSFTRLFEEFRKNPVIEFLRVAMAYYFKHRPQISDERTAVLHDPLALALSIRPNLARYIRREVTVDVTDTATLGRTTVPIGEQRIGRRVDIATYLDRTKFAEFVLENLRRAAKRHIASVHSWQVLPMGY